jgi:hypothetical protein
MKKIIIISAVILLVGVGAYFFIKNSSQTPSQVTETPPIITTGTVTQQPKTETATTTKKVEQVPGEAVIGKSVEGRDIKAYTYGTGKTKLLFVGGIHGGYEWNTVLLAYQLSDYLKANPKVVPANVQVTVIPVLNPDGLNITVGSPDRFVATAVPSAEGATVAGRFNSSNVDLNRNFDCSWQASGVWQKKPVSGGSKAFSEPESLAMKNYIEENKPSAAVVWFSAAGGIFASSCEKGILPDTIRIMDTYAAASGYPKYDSFDFYETSGDMVNWFAKSNVPAVSVILTDHKNVEWSKNLKGVEALLKSYSK